MSERPRGIFTTDDREYLKGNKEYKHDTTEANVKARIRERVYHVILDGGMLWDIPADERRKIFRQWEEADAEEFGQFKSGIAGLIAFLYRGYEDAGGDFEKMYYRATEAAEREGYDTERLLERFYEGDPTLSDPELRHLREEIGVDMNEYYDRRDARVSPGWGRVGQGDPADRDEGNDAE